MKILETYKPANPAEYTEPLSHFVTSVRAAKINVNFGEHSDNKTTFSLSVAQIKAMVVAAEHYCESVASENLYHTIADLTEERNFYRMAAEGYIRDWMDKLEKSVVLTTGHSNWQRMKNLLNKEDRQRIRDLEFSNKYSTQRIEDQNQEISSITNNMINMKETHAKEIDKLKKELQQLKELNHELETKNHNLIEIKKIGEEERQKEELLEQAIKEKETVELLKIHQYQHNKSVSDRLDDPAQYINAEEALLEALSLLAKRRKKPANLKLEKLLQTALEDVMAQGSEMAMNPISQLLTFDEFQQLSTARCEAIFHPIDDWSISEWTNALCGEAGEAANFSKKIKRYTDTGKLTPKLKKKLMTEIGKEVADVICYAFILCSKLKVNASEIVKNKFNEVSKRYNCDITI